jgi:hypothetical protein
VARFIGRRVRRPRHDRQAESAESAAEVRLVGHRSP